MRETCYCGRTDDLRNREPVLDDDSRWALRCPACGHLDYLHWLPDEAGLLLCSCGQQPAELNTI